MIMTNKFKCIHVILHILHTCYNNGINIGSHEPNTTTRLNIGSHKPNTQSRINAGSHKPTTKSRINTGSYEPKHINTAC